MEVVVLGCGYVGTVIAASMAHVGHNVIAYDINKERVESLSNGNIPIYEPNLQQLVQESLERHNLKFSNNIEDCLEYADVCFLAVPTPSCSNSECDLSFLESASRTLGKHINKPLIVINKSTAPPGTTEKIDRWIRESSPRAPFEVVSNPEFLQEGKAVDRFLHPDRVIIGCKTEETKAKIEELYSKFELPKEQILFMDPISAELTKYASNIFLANRISLINEIALLADEYGANISDIKLGIGSDHRIGKYFLNAGIGFGGSCFTKDIDAMIAEANRMGVDVPLLEAIQKVNRSRADAFLNKLRKIKECSSLEGQTVCVLGLSYKPNTDDLREAPAIRIIQRLLDDGAVVQACDPKALKNAQKVLNHPNLKFIEDPFDAAENADALLVLTEWSEFRELDYKKLYARMRIPVILDGRNCLNSQLLLTYGFDYYGVGIPHASH